MTILKMNRKANADKKGPRMLIASFAVSGSKSNSINLCISGDEACEVSIELLVKALKTSSELRGLLGIFPFD